MLAAEAASKVSIMAHVAHLEEANQNLMATLSNIHRQFGGLFGTLAKHEQYAHPLDPYIPLKQTEYQVDARAIAAAEAHVECSSSEPDGEARPEAEVRMSCVAGISGDVSIEKRLAEHGAGKSEQVGSLAVSAAWNNTEGHANDVDLWVTTPSGEKIFYSHKNSACGGELDVDMQQSAKNPVENIVWKSNAPKGDYKVELNNYSTNHNETVPCEVMIVKDGGRPEKFNVSIPAEAGGVVHVTTVTVR